MKPKLIKSVTHAPHLTRSAKASVAMPAKALPAIQAAPIAPPTMLEAISNFHAAAKRALSYVLKRGLKGFVVDQATFETRLDGCRNCPGKHWTEDGTSARCLHPECGCTKLKHWLSTERCPIGVWTEEGNQ